MFFKRNGNKIVIIDDYDMTNKYTCGIHMYEIKIKSATWIHQVWRCLPRILSSLCGNCQAWCRSARNNWNST